MTVRELHIAFNVAARREGAECLPACDGAECRICAALSPMPADDRYIASHVVPTYTNSSLRILKDTEAAGILISRQDADQIQAERRRLLDLADRWDTLAAQEVEGGHLEYAAGRVQSASELRATLADQTPETTEP